MKNGKYACAIAALMAGQLAGQTGQGLYGDTGERGRQKGYTETDLVVNKQSGGVPTLLDSNGVTHVAKFFDPHLVNPWGLTESGTSAFWVADGGAGVTTLYNTAGAPQPLIVATPGPSN